MTTRTVTLSGDLAGKRFGGSVKRTGTTETNAETNPALPAGTAGTLSTRTDLDTGAVTLPAGHGLTSGTYDVFWTAAAGTPGVHRGMAGTVTADSLAIDAGSGDDLPPLNSPVVVCKQTILDFDSDNASIILAMVAQQRRASVQFQDNAGAAILSLDLGKDGADGEPFVWASNQNVASPFGAAVSKIAVSNGSAGGSNTVTVGVLRS